MISVPRSRRRHLDLLRRPQTSQGVDRWSTALTVDPQAQLEELADLVERGLMSATEFENQRRKVSDI